MATTPNDEPWRVDGNRPSLRDAVAAQVGDAKDLKPTSRRHLPVESLRTQRTRALGRLVFVAVVVIAIAVKIAMAIADAAADAAIQRQNAESGGSTWCGEASRGGVRGRAGNGETGRYPLPRADGGSWRRAAERRHCNSLGRKSQEHKHQRGPVSRGAATPRTRAATKPIRASPITPRSGGAAAPRLTGFPAPSPWG